MERRRYPRGRSYYGGVIAFNARKSTIDCVVRNFSQAGAKIAMTGTVLLPDSFDLTIRRRETWFRARLVWRNSSEAGVTFDPTGSPAVVSLDVARKLHLAQGGSHAAATAGVRAVRWLLSPAARCRRISSPTTAAPS